MLYPHRLKASDRNTTRRRGKQRKTHNKPFCGPNFLLTNRKHEPSFLYLREKYYYKKLYYSCAKIMIMSNLLKFANFIHFAISTAIAALESLK